MKKSLLILLGVIATNASLADDFRTNDGKEYKNARVSRAEPDGIVIITDSGIIKLYFAELPKEISEKYHYDPAKAAAFSNAQAQVQRSVDERIRVTKEVEAKAVQEDEPIDPMSQGGRLHQIEIVSGKVLKKLGDKKLIVRSSGKTILLRGHPNWVMLAPGDDVKVRATGVGTVQYNGSTIHAYDFSQ